jgi:hypothetical protein
MWPSREGHKQSSVVLTPKNEENIVLAESVYSKNTHSCKSTLFIQNAAGKREKGNKKEREREREKEKEREKREREKRYRYR